MAEHARVFRSAYAFCSNREVAEDSTQEAFSRALARWKRLRTEPWAGAWVTKVAINACKKALRRRERNTGEPLLDDPGDLVETRQDLLRALQTLSSRQREAVILYYLGDYPLAACAQVMNVSEGAVKTHLSRARSALRGPLEDVDV